MQRNQFDVIVIGGGAAGFFAAINLAEQRSDLRIAILERGKEVLQKVRISGGGRCNATHACWEPKELTQYYPRGRKELLGPFHKFCTGDTVDWFETRGVELKIEEDGRMFPITDSSQTIIDCFETAVKQTGIQVLKSSNVAHIQAVDEGWLLSGPSNEWSAKSVVMAPGSSKQVWSLLAGLGHHIVEPVPSLFTFNCKDTRLRNMSGLSVANAQVKVLGSALESEGPLLVTHWGLSGPAVLKLSAWGARALHGLHYKFQIEVNFSGLEPDAAAQELKDVFETNARRQVGNTPLFGIPKRLWQSLVPEALAGQSCAALPVSAQQQLLKAVCAAQFSINGKSTFKEEFVTAGGVDLSEVDFRTMESKLHSGLYFTGEVLNIDAITGGFNFQAAWTTAWLAARAVGSPLL